MLSSACQDTIRAAVWLATKPLDQYHRIQIISEALNLPYFHHPCCGWYGII